MGIYLMHDAHVQFSRMLTGYHQQEWFFIGDYNQP